MVMRMMMKKSAWVIGVLALGVTYACAGSSTSTPPPPPVPAQGTSADEATLRGLAAKYSTSFNANDAAALAAMVSEDFEGISADGTHTKGRAAYLQMEQAGVKERADAKMTLTLTTTTSYLNWIDANHAVLGGTYAMAGLPPGAPDKGAWIVACEKTADGQWLIENSLVADMAPPPPPPVPPAKK
jgi:uncharacterized protein (TIGR02246 family)